MRPPPPVTRRSRASSLADVGRMLGRARCEPQGKLHLIHLRTISAQGCPRPAAQRLPSAHGGHASADRTLRRAPRASSPPLDSCREAPDGSCPPSLPPSVAQMVRRWSQDSARLRVMRVCAVDRCALLADPVRARGSGTGHHRRRGRNSSGPTSGRPPPRSPTVSGPPSRGPIAWRDDWRGVTGRPIGSCRSAAPPRRSSSSRRSPPWRQWRPASRTRLRIAPESAIGLTADEGAIDALAWRRSMFDEGLASRWEQTFADRPAEEAG